MSAQNNILNIKNNLFFQGLVFFNCELCGEIFVRLFVMKNHRIQDILVHGTKSASYISNQTSVIIYLSNKEEVERTVWRSGLGPGDLIIHKRIP